VWNGYGVCSNLASSGEPPLPLLHMTTLTTVPAVVKEYDSTPLITTDTGLQFLLTNSVIKACKLSVCVRSATCFTCTSVCALVEESVTSTA